MANITVKMKDGTIRNFREEGRPGGSFSNKVRYEGSMVIIVDEWYKETAIPVEDVAEVVKESPERW